MKTLPIRNILISFSRLAVFVVLGLILNGGQALAVETSAAFDPTCSAASRFNRVISARFEAQKLYRKNARRSRLTPLVERAPEMGVFWDAQGKGPQLTLRSEAGSLLQLESTASLLQPIPLWQPLLGLQLSGTEYQWFDSSAASEAERFYRLAELADPLEVEQPDDFMLLDQDGKAHELFYHTELDALVVLAVGNSIDLLPAALQQLKSLIESYGTNRVRFWTLLSDPAATRDQVSAEVNAAGIEIPVLLDPLNFGAHALHIRHAGEIVVIQPTLEGLPIFGAAFRGQLSAGEEDSYVRAGISSLTQKTPLTFFRRPASGASLANLDTAAPDYATEVAPIFYQYCVKCHRPNDVAPFALTDYATAQSWSQMIKHELLSGEMPPWHVDPDHGVWTNSLALPQAAKSTLLRWIDAGAPRGDGPDPLAELPLPPSYRQWPPELGEPDAIVQTPLQQVRADGTEPYRYVFVQTPNSTSVWLRAAIILPSTPEVVHHFLVWTGKVGNQSPIPGFSTYQSSLAGYVPGMLPYQYPPDTGFLLGASNWLTFNLHYTPKGTATNDQPTLALWYHKTKPARTYHQDSINNFLITIPPETQEFPVAAQMNIPNTIRLHRLNPHMHLRGKKLQVPKHRFILMAPAEILLSVAWIYNFLWQNWL